jgi:hypothetical protein
MSGDTHALRVVIEQGKTKAFASAIDWPGWSRSGKKTPDAAIEALLDYRDRYQTVVDLANGVAFPDGEFTVEVVEQQKGDGQTDYGVPGQVAASEFSPIEGKELERHISILQACWASFDQVRARVSPSLRKGPRGGGRGRDEIVEHVLGAEGGYARHLGLERPDVVLDDAAVLADQRAAVVAALREHGPTGNLPERKWPVRYTIRRMAWHVMDHAWEMEDKDLSGDNAS